MKVTDVPAQTGFASAVIVTVTGRMAFTITVLVSELGRQVPPVAVSVSIAVPVNPAGGVHVAFSVVGSGVKVPPAEDVQRGVPSVIVPPRATVVPSWQILSSVPDYCALPCHISAKKCKK